VACYAARMIIARSPRNERRVDTFITGVRDTVENARRRVLRNPRSPKNWGRYSGKFRSPIMFSQV
jgi:hypothetical protein